MAGETVVTVVGNLTADPEMRFTANGAGVVNFTVASTPRTFDRNTNEWKDGDALFLRCSAWRDMAENIAETLQKGMRVIVQGSLRQSSYQAQDGSTRTSLELLVDEVGPSLRYASASVNRKARSGGSGFTPASSSNAQAASSKPAVAPKTAVDQDPWVSDDISSPEDIPF
ncbi:MAG: single-stranded DNA-binding protein [Candidatus Ancillula sp.]|jgi:single-strand DNA-binding protein|nr:single-stranded DNA-binding protein [Candidatus Ancillula sp.]